jgi:drug/metabolite transporter (DMT)-like permease
MTAVLLALASAWALAVGTVLAHRAATATAPAAGRSGRDGLVRQAGRLVKHPGFLAAQLAGVVGLVLHGAALATGLVVVVQPLLCTGLVMALVLGAVLDRRHPDRPLPHRRQWIAAILVVLGLGLFLVTAAPAAGAGHAVTAALPLSVAAFAALSATVAVRVRRGRIRHAALALGAVAGTGLGLMGVLLKVVTVLPVVNWAGSWSSWALLGVGLVATAFAQWSYGAGPLVQSQPVLTALEPVVALALAGPVFAEGLAGGLVAHAGQLAGLALMVVGVVGVARHAAAVAPTPAADAPRVLTAGGPLR